MVENDAGQLLFLFVDALINKIESFPGSRKFRMIVIEFVNVSGFLGLHNRTRDLVVKIPMTIYTSPILYMAQANQPLAPLMFHVTRSTRRRGWLFSLGVVCGRFVASQACIVGYSMHKILQKPCRLLMVTAWYMTHFALFCDEGMGSR